MVRLSEVESNQDSQDKPAQLTSSQVMGRPWSGWGEKVLGTEWGSAYQ